MTGFFPSFSVVHCFSLNLLQIYWPPLPGNREDCIQMGKEPQVSVHFSMRHF